MRSIKTVLFFLFFVLFHYNITAQNNLVGFPTPEAAELGKYGQVPVSYFNGLPEISIPLYTIQCNDLQLPISLTYYAGGNKPDDYPGWVGLGWNLNAGGIITRVVNGIRDELRKEDFSKELGANVTFSFESGYYYRAADMNVNDWSTTLLAKLVSNDLSYAYLDSQPDEFIFNFNGFSGSFYFVNIDGQMEVKVKSKNGEILKVVPMFVM